MADKRRRRLELADHFLRIASAAVVAGIVGGLVAAGGSRVAMRVSALMADPCAGVMTENGNACGKFTAEGTVGLIFFGVLFSGIPGGLVYAAASPWLRPFGRLRGVAFGVAAFALGGFTVIEGDNPDFERFGSPGLNVLMFAALFLIFGLVAAPTFDAVERRMPHLPPRRPLTFARLTGYGVMFVTAIVLGFVAAFGLGLGLLILVSFGFAHRLGKAVTEARERGETRATAAYLLPLAFVAAAGFFTVQSVTRVLG